MVIGGIADRWCHLINKQFWIWLFCQQNPQTGTSHWRAVVREQLAQGCYLIMDRPRDKPPTLWSLGSMHWPLDYRAEAKPIVCFGWEFHGSCPFVKIKFKDFWSTFKDNMKVEWYTSRTKLNQTGTFVSIYNQVQFTFDNLTLSGINQKLELSEKFTKFTTQTHATLILKITSSAMAF